MLSNEEILSHLRQAEELIVKAAQLLNEVHSSSKNHAGPISRQLRRDISAYNDIYPLIFRLVEPCFNPSYPTVKLELLRDNDRSPRGNLSRWRLQYEIDCGLRQSHHSSEAGWRYPSKIPCIRGCGLLVDASGTTTCGSGSRECHEAKTAHSNGNRCSVGCSGCPKFHT